MRSAKFDAPDRHNTQEMFDEFGHRLELDFPIEMGVETWFSTLTLTWQGFHNPIEHFTGLLRLQSLSFLVVVLM